MTLASDGIERRGYLPPVVPPVLTYGARDRARAELMRALLLAAMLTGLGVLGLVVAILHVLEVGVVVYVAAAVMALLPLPLYLAPVLILDAFDAKPKRALVLAFVWGGSFAALVAYVINTTASLATAALTQNNAIAAFMGGNVSAPLVEEAVKAAAVVTVFLMYRRRFWGLADFVVVSTVAALGFAAVENISYYGRSLHAGPGTMLETLSIRGLASPFIHPLFTAVFALAFGLSCRLPGVWPKVAGAVAGYWGAVGLHFLWNLVMWTGSMELAGMSYVLFWLPLLLCVGVICVASVVQKVRAVRRSHGGAMSWRDLAWRMVGNVNTLARDGGEAWVTLRRRQRAVIEGALRPGSIIGH